MSHPLVVHCKKKPFDVYIGRPSPWGNPFCIGPGATRADVVARYRAFVMEDDQAWFRSEVRKKLKGKILGCWCAPRACHGDVLAEIAEGL